MFPSRFYAILDVDRSAAAGLKPLEVLDAWLEAGVRVVQLRAKSLEGGAFLALAETGARRAQAVGAVFIVNDRADVARLVGADGVHVGQDDLTPAEARAVFGDGGLVGLSTHTPAQVDAALEQPISYLAIGPVFATATKATGQAAVGLEGVRMAANAGHRAGRPVVAIGGITLDTVRAVLEAGATSAAVISDLLRDDPLERAREYLKATE